MARNILIDYLRRKKWDAKAGPDGPAGVDPRTPADEFESLEIFLAISALGRKKARALEAFYLRRDERPGDRRRDGRLGTGRRGTAAPGPRFAEVLASRFNGTTEGKMPKNLEPDSQFVNRLEWQLASEFRRTDRLKPAAGKVAVPRRWSPSALAAGVLLMGVAATKAADLIKDSWRKKIEVARLETRRQDQEGLSGSQEGDRGQGRDASSRWA